MPVLHQVFLDRPPSSTSFVFLRLSLPEADLKILAPSPSRPCIHLQAPAFLRVQPSCLHSRCQWCLFASSVVEAPRKYLPLSSSRNPFYNCFHQSTCDTFLPTWQ